MNERNIAQLKVKKYCQMEKHKRTNNDLQNIHINLNIE